MYILKTSLPWALSWRGHCKIIRHFFSCLPIPCRHRPWPRRSLHRADTAIATAAAATEFRPTRLPIPRRRARSGARPRPQTRKTANNCKNPRHRARHWDVQSAPATSSAARARSMLNILLRQLGVRRCAQPIPARPVPGSANAAGNLQARDTPTYVPAACACPLLIRRGRRPGGGPPLSQVSPAPENRAQAVAPRPLP